MFISNQNLSFIAILYPVFSYSMQRGLFWKKSVLNKLTQETWRIMISSDKWETSKKCSSTRTRQKTSGLKSDLLYTRFYKPTPLFYPLQWMSRVCSKMHHAKCSDCKAAWSMVWGSAHCAPGCAGCPAPGKHCPALLRHPWDVGRVQSGTGTPGRCKGELLIAKTRLC